jgi:two-component sensor histidine kinase
MTTGFFNGDILRGLAARVLLFLSLALLPIGIIAIVQTRAISDQSRASAELSLIGATEIATSGEQQIFQDAFSAAKALSSVVRLRRQNNDECSGFLEEYKVASGIYSLVAFTALDGIMSCSSVGRSVDLSNSEEFKKAVKLNRRHAIANDSPSISGEPVVVVYSPVVDRRETIGIMAVSIPSSTLSKPDEPEQDLTPITVMTVNRSAEVLTNDGKAENPAQELPIGFEPMRYPADNGRVFEGRNDQGEDRVYAVIPVVPDTIFAVSVWPADALLGNRDITSRLSSITPILMWVASLVVAFWALNRLAIKHIRKLGRQMRRFAMNRTLPPDTLDPSVPKELVDMEQAFLDMAESLLQDEAVLENSLREKNILLKEVHHRVKNNLQLISSILNMQIRLTGAPGEREVLQRLQQRILGLATVHENLYKNDNLVRVDASVLLRKLVDQVVSLGLVPITGLTITQNYDEVMLDPDDAAPLALLVAEAVSNALKYADGGNGASSKVDVELSQVGEADAKLTVRNSVAATDVEDVKPGLGTKLITAFARQLNGNLKIARQDDGYDLTVTFPLPKGTKPVHDY